MNIWFKVGVPVLIVALFIMSAVSITMAVTATNSVNKVAAASYDTGALPASRLAEGPSCPNCPGYAQGAGSGNQGAVTGCQGSCGGTCGYQGTAAGCQGNCGPSGNQYSCCGANGQSVTPRVSRGGCCGAK